ncbi:actin [Podila epicladia]|nr:actin [Podila epicladia]
MADFGRPIVLDVGGAYIRSGFAGEHQPRHTDPSVTAKTKHMGCCMGYSMSDYYMGDAAFDRSTWFAELQYPLERGIIDWDSHRRLGGNQWDHHERLIHNAFYNSLRLPPEDHPVLMTEAMFCSRATRERLAMIMFETFMPQALYLGLKPVLALMATGATTGLVIDSGESATNVVPVYRDLGWNKLGDNGALELSEALKINSTLITMNLVNSLIGDSGAQALAEAFKINSSLTMLD